MTKNLVIFGAGASVTTGTPVIATLLDAAHRLYANPDSTISRKAFESTFDLLQNRLPTLHAKSAVNLDNLEAVYGLVEMAEILGRLPGTSKEELATLHSDLRTVLAETIQCTCRFVFDPTRGWLPPKDYSDFATVVSRHMTRSFRNKWTFVTFNYDIALDFALLASGFEVDYTFATISPAVRQFAAPLLKLHGSLNWGTSPGQTTLRWLNLRLFFEQIAPGMAGEFHWPILEALRMVEHSEDVFVALAPPSWNKFQHYRTFLPIWQRAATALAEAEAVYVIGYSAPKTDGFFQDLLALGLQGPTRLQRFCVVNNDQGAIDRIGEMLGPQIRPRFDPQLLTFREFIPRFSQMVEEE